MGDATIEHAIKQLEAEQAKRRQEYRQKLIDSFYEAWVALRKACVTMRYNHWGDEDDDGVYLDHWDGFNFD